MIDLPRALLPWKKALALFPRELALPLGDLVGKLALLVGPLAAPEGGGAGDPDGVGGIGRRGPFERLLATEWALAEEAPEEFLRRAVTAELSFVELSHRRPAAARRSVVLFDVGPDQLGAPRVAHLAALVLLAQRADEAGASFAWGVLQDPACALTSAVTEASVRGLLRQRSARRASAEDARRFREALGHGAAEVWVVGAPEAAKACEALSPERIEIEDSFDPGALHSIEVRAFVGRRAPRAARLDLPAEALTVRLLRDPFGAVSAAPLLVHAGMAFAPGTNILFGWDDKKIFLRGALGELLTIPVPNSPNVQPPPHPRVFRPPVGEVLVGVGERRGRAGQLAVTQRDGELIVHTLSRRLGASAGSARFRCAEAVAEDARLGLLCPLDEEIFFFHDARGRLLRLADGEAQVFQMRIAALCHHVDPIMVTPGAPPNVLTVGSDKQRKIFVKTAMVVPVKARGEEAVLGWGVVALRVSNATWVVHVGPAGSDLRRTPRPGDEVVGVVQNVDPSRTGLVVLDASRTRIEHIGETATTTWVTSAAPITYARASDMKGHIALITEDGALSVYSPHERARVLHLVPRAP
ncbi:hypothetical protein [Polyangium aurulentum]|uniref:hypothetical protein n=1 Tax=Polyangium aurulentum TaxID=2567896 RepID=UPI0010ADDD49|nr:hypothetical protein [Polyangium aurulentum]UQA57501.1 hypothetical protein E8A73_040490 [Polyangium aurulentum]